MAAKSGGSSASPPVLINCSHCNSATLGTQRGTYELMPQGEEEFEPTLFSLVSCDGCRSAQVVSQTGDLFGDRWSWGDSRTEWPDDRVAPLHPNIPKAIAREMREAQECFGAKLYTATAVMVRRSLEGMCEDQGTTEKTLFKALHELRNSGKIEGRLFDWTQALRVIGNQGAHFSKESVSREDAEDALALAEALLNYIYVFTAKYEEFQNRRAGKSK
ncbi:DUF4145 domain-containing protein [Streptomyces sp. NBC_01795]|uniref:DUF4145 domain-containing protein n=1 Tax=unclassified Streptomyces TaxID=2593676 RepID=UPI002DD8ED43|nr:MULTISPECIES: DUF4145 domain-containing protein [unclassified Streptomyces]WSA92345.1 DUF4145 domain-containing protein [Streptomyces sp. NBC_01795]WSB76714.1 DUF4145 domain-containing protein [Streptomyces sp. NBC_01775]